MLNNFQNEFKKIVATQDDLSLDIFCAMTNSNYKFLSLLREFVDRVQKGSGMDADLIKIVIKKLIILEHKLAGFNLEFRTNFECLFCENH